MQDNTPINTPISTPMRRRVDADHSCLFSSLAYLLDRADFDENSKNIWRNKIIEFIKHNDFPEGYFDDGKSKEEYIEWLSDTSNWGGGIELKIISDIYKVKIVVITKDTGKVDVFGEEHNDYLKTIYLVYTGVHYDPLVSVVDQADIQKDITIFPTTDIEKNTKMFKEYIFNIKSQIRIRSEVIYIKCKICSKKFLGEKGGQEHFSDTGHRNFIRIGKPKIKCESCYEVFDNEQEAENHAEETKHMSFFEL